MDVLYESQQLMLNKSIVEASVKRTTLIEEEGDDESETEDSGEDEFESSPPPKRARVVLRPSKKGEAKGSLKNKPAKSKSRGRIEEEVRSFEKEASRSKSEEFSPKQGDQATWDADLHWGQRHLLPLLDDGIMEGLTREENEVEARKNVMDTVHEINTTFGLKPRSLCSTADDYVNDDIVNGSQPNPDLVPQLSDSEYLDCHVNQSQPELQRRAEKNEAFKDMDITGEDAPNIPNMVSVSGEQDKMVEDDVVRHSVNEDAGKPMDDDVQLDVNDDAENTNNGILKEISPKVMVSGERDEMVEDDVVRHSINEDAGKIVEDDVQLDVEDDAANTNGGILKEISPKAVDMYMDLLRRWYTDKDGPGGHEPKYNIVSASFFLDFLECGITPVEYVLMGSSGRELDFNDNGDGKQKGRTVEADSDLSSGYASGSDTSGSGGGSLQAGESTETYSTSNPSVFSYGNPSTESEETVSDVGNSSDGSSEEVSDESFSSTLMVLF
ncbi:hypothetical protein IFM89_009224 [Coptis chinensis]|uniref:Uncharacterized protein n=1 Tax=Coptis chinensis TaxID=261450 RepID=A0A835IUH0_9MAGN|nr:hypothetical protein IFM89_009224 [Coptis chinensis]